MATKMHGVPFHPFKRLKTFTSIKFGTSKYLMIKIYLHSGNNLKGLNHVMPEKKKKNVFY